MRRLVLLTALCGLFSLSGTAAVYQVTMNTPSLDGQNGSIDIQFNPGAFPAVFEAGSASISNFTLTGGTLGAEQGGTRVNAIGDLAPGPLVITNADFLNGITYDATFGTGLSFQVDFTGAAFTASNQTILTDFFFFVTAGDSVTAQATLLGDSTLDTTNSSNGVTFTPDTAIPEPGTLVLFGCGAAVLALLRKR